MTPKIKAEMEALSLTADGWAYCPIDDFKRGFTAAHDLLTARAKEVIVDPEDQHLLIKYKWRLVKGRGKSTYAVATNEKRKLIRLHRLIMNATSGSVVDHINGNTLDNRRANLRICSHSINMRNKGKIKKKAHLPKNIAAHPYGFRVQFKLNGKCQCSKLFKDLVEAVNFRDEWIRKNNWKGFA